MDAIGCLGLVLHWYRTRGSVARSTAVAFGLTASTAYVWLSFSRRILLFVLQKNPNAKVSPPTAGEVEDYMAAIGANYPALGTKRVWGVADGRKVLLQGSSDGSVKNQFYNEGIADTCINNVFVFAPDGRIRMCTINAPGTWDDSTMAEYGVYPKLEEVFDQHGATVVVGSAFQPRSEEFLIQSSQTDPDDAEGSVVNRQATSLCQLSEWGMRMIQLSFPRLKERLLLEEFGERKVILNLSVLLYNYQASTVGMNQIFNTFMSRTKGFYSYDASIEITEDANGVFDTYRNLPIQG